MAYSKLSQCCFSLPNTVHLCDYWAQVGLRRSLSTTGKKRLQHAGGYGVHEVVFSTSHTKLCGTSTEGNCRWVSNGWGDADHEFASASLVQGVGNGVRNPQQYELVFVSGLGLGNPIPFQIQINYAHEKHIPRILVVVDFEFQIPIPNPVLGQTTFQNPHVLDLVRQKYNMHGAGSYKRHTLYIIRLFHSRWSNWHRIWQIILQKVCVGIQTQALNRLTGSDITT